MCGIWLSLGIEAPKSVISSVAHRGPDDEGWRQFETSHGPLIMAHRRLAVFDTSKAGHQPMPYENERYWLVYNGEIYNHVELREELSNLGHSFCSSSDSEVLLAAFAEWGKDCLDRFNGMFAFVIWDSAKRELFAARDRFGVKPLYIWQSQSGIAFASEIKQFLELDNFSARLNHGPAYDFLTYGLLDHTTETMFKDVNQVNAGEYVTLGLGENESISCPRYERWYELPEFGKNKMPVSTAIDQFQALFNDSVKLRLRSDISVGSCLSGGLDSSAIVLTAEKFKPGFVTVSACYKNWKGDESTFMNAVNERIDSNPVQVFPEFDQLRENLDKLIYHQDAPVGSTSAFAQWCVFRAAKKAAVPVMLDGQGADEQLAGYYPAFSSFHSGLLRRGKIIHLIKEMMKTKDRHQIGLTRQLANLLHAALPISFRRYLIAIRGISNPEWLNSNFANAHRVHISDTKDLNSLLRDQMLFSTLPGLLHYEDRNSMAFGVESRLPFLDFRLVELLIGLGDNYKIVKGETKWVLRQALSKILPDIVLNRQDKVAFEHLSQIGLLAL